MPNATLGSSGTSPVGACASSTEAHGINNAGVIVGTANNYGFIDFGGQFFLMGIDGATVVNPMTINNADTVVGSYWGSQGRHV